MKIGTATLQMKKKRAMTLQKRGIEQALAIGIPTAIAKEVKGPTKLFQTACQTQMKMRNATLQTKRKTVTTLQRRRIELALATGILAAIATEVKRPTKLFQIANQTQMKMRNATLQTKKNTVTVLHMRNRERT